MAEPLRNIVPAPSLEGRIPPQAVEIEAQVLGAMLVEREAIPRVIEVLDEDAFHADYHRKIFQAIVAMFDRSEPVDIITLAEELRRRGHLEVIGGEAYLAELTMKVASSANAEYHAKIVLEKYLMRELIKTASELQARGYSPSEDTFELLDQAEQMIFQISEKRLKKTFTQMRKAVHDTLETLQALHGTHSGITGVPTGFRDFDTLTGGLQNSDLIIVAGRPSSGKTAFALSLARNAALHREKPTGVGIFSLEMSTQQMVMRLLCAEARVDAHAIRTGRLPEDDWKRVSIAAGKLAAANIFIDDTPSLGILELRAKARRLKAERNIGLIVIDYLQLMQGPKDAENREKEISAISRSLKALAKELDIPVIALSQLSRAVESRSDKRPILSDLRECVSGDTQVYLADGRAVPISDLEASQPIVLSVAADRRIVPAQAEIVWRVGKKPVYEVQLASGRTLKCTAEHRLYGFGGWVRVSELRVGMRLAIAQMFVHVKQQMMEKGTSHRAMATLRETAYGGTSHFRFDPSRDVVLGCDEILPDDALHSNTSGDIVWDTVAAVDRAGEEDVYDLTVPTTASWLANGIVSHNSGAIEQDADLVCFVHRPSMYADPDATGYAETAGEAEIIVGKHRNGPVGDVKLTFVRRYARFENPAPQGFEGAMPPSGDDEAPF